MFIRKFRLISSNKKFFALKSMCDCSRVKGNQLLFSSFPLSSRTVCFLCGCWLTGAPPDFPGAFPISSLGYSTFAHYGVYNPGKRCSWNSVLSAAAAKSCGGERPEIWDDRLRHAAGEKITMTRTLNSARVFSAREEWLLEVVKLVFFRILPGAGRQRSFCIRVLNSRHCVVA